MAVTSLGFNVPSGSTISVSEPEFSMGGRVVATVDARLNEWTSQSSLWVTFELDIDLPRALRQCSLPDETELIPAEFGGVINWRSTLTNLHGSSAPIRLRDGINSLELELDGAMLGGDLILRPSVILLKNPHPERTSIAPSKLGSRIWEEQFKVQLEGDGSQFPVSAFDFEKVGYTPEKAMWKVHIETDLDSHVSSAVRLHLNTGHPRIKQYLKNPEAKSEKEFQQFLRADVVCQLITFALNSDLHELEEFGDGEGSFAETLMQMINSYFPGMTASSLLSMYKNDPSFLTATVQAALFDKARKLGK